MLNLFFSLTLSKRFEIYFKNATIVDGSGSRALANGYVGVNSKKIEFVGYGDEGLKHSGITEIDASGYLLTPGFFDAHAHLDEVPMLEPNFTFQITQGVTTIVTGPCGVSAAPTRMDPAANHYSYLLLDRVTQWKENPPVNFSMYYQYLDNTKFAVNIAPMLGHSNIRDWFFGNVNITFNETMMEKAKAMVKEAMDAGAFGMTAGLMYTPSGYADVTELGELCSVIKPYGGIFMNHIRSESDRLVESVQETIDVGAYAGIPVQIHHMKSTGFKNVNKSKGALKIMEEARNRGQDVTADQYPYLMANTNLACILPPWVLEGDKETVVGRLTNPESRKQIMEEVMDNTTSTYDNYWVAVGNDPSKIIITRGAAPEYMGKNLVEASGLQGEVEILNWTIDFIIDTYDVSPLANFYALNEEDMRRIMLKDYVMIGSDSDVYYEGEELTIQHPRNMASHAVYLRKYVKEEHFLSLEQAIRKMTSLIAERFGISDKGLIKEGYSADINVFKLEEVNDTTGESGVTYLSTGMKYVMNNGEFLIENYSRTGNLPGKALRKTYYQSLKEKSESDAKVADPFYNSNVLIIILAVLLIVSFAVNFVLALCMCKKRKREDDASILLTPLKA